MEDAADAVVPLRPGFDVQIRGFNRNQVVEHIELLEDQLKLVTLDRNEAVQLNTDLRRLCDDTRTALDEAERRLKSIESSDTGLPAASQRVHNMLTSAEEEVQTLRAEAQRQADVIRGTAETEARELISQAEHTTRELRSECTSLISDVEARRDQLRREYDQNLSELRARENRLRQEIRNEYKKIVGAAQEESDEILTEARRQCGQWDAATERMRLDALEEIHSKQMQLEQLRHGVLSTMDNARDLLDNSADTLRCHDWHPLSSPIADAQNPAGYTEESAPTQESTDQPEFAGAAPPEAAVNLPEPRDTQRDFSTDLEEATHRNGDGEAYDPGAVRQH